MSIFSQVNGTLQVAELVSRSVICVLAGFKPTTTGEKPITAAKITITITITISSAHQFAQLEIFSIMKFKTHARDEQEFYNNT